jgi:predicted metal-dependent hydrolase
MYHEALGMTMSKQTDQGFTEYHLSTIAKGIELFNAQQYWECHEELEHHWIEDTSDPVRYVYWAIIQIAASMIHYRDGNIVGARGLLIKARDKIKKCETLSLESNLLFESINWLEFKQKVNEVQDIDNLTAYKNLYDFRFVIQGN